MPQPLSGLLVLDFSTLLPGPLATLMLAEAGAEVVKIERPGGETMRAIPPAWDGVGAAFAMLNRGKSGLLLDLKQEADRRRLAPLLARADILVEQFRPGVMAEFGLDYEAVRKLNPRIVYCSISGYGQSGPRAREAGHDINYIGATGLLALQPGPASHPDPPPALIADIGAYAQAHPPRTPFDLSQGVQFAIEAYDGDLLVTDGHHNRVLRVTRKGRISVFRAFGNIVPTGLAVDGSTVYMARAGAAPHEPADGRVHAFGPGWKTVATVATGAPLLVDVEFGGGRNLYALAQGTWDGAFPGSPALPMTGSLVRLDGRGKFAVVAEPLNLPTSLEIVRKDAYVVTLAGEVWKLTGVIRPPFPKD